LESTGQTEELERFRPALDEALYRDAIVKVSWTGQADVDVMVEEPGGSLCSRINQRTSSGGVMMGDSAYAPNSDQELAEYYVLPRGFAGDYRVFIQKRWGEIAGGKVSVEIYRNYRTAFQTGQQQQVALDNGMAVVVFNLEKGRRQDGPTARPVHADRGGQRLSRFAQRQRRRRGTEQ
jgi:hypothetical protein